MEKFFQNINDDNLESVANLLYFYLNVLLAMEDKSKLAAEFPMIVNFLQLILAKKESPQNIFLTKLA